ncbi:MAG: hypothetical protein CMJ36_03515 [Phycisphaerae bacterium]|nr:hypothetical protein [Phycisphaerae bacterium]
MAGEATISLRDVNKQFGNVHAVRDLSLDVHKGSLIGFLGPNGAGKSTTIRMIMSIIYPDSGSIDVLGDSALAAKDRIGYLPEERGLYRKMRVAEYLHYIGRLKGLPRSSARSAAKYWLDRMELVKVERKRCEELSKGMQQKVQFIASILHEPDLLILDEPFSGLDPVNAELLNEVIRDLNAQGRTIIFSTHVLHQAEQLCDSILLIDRGEKILDDTMEGIRSTFNPRTIEVEPVMGQQLPVTIEGVERRSNQGDEGVELHLRPDTDPQDVMRSILGACPVRSIRLRRPTLDEIFVMLVRDRKHEAREEHPAEGVLS